jgi:DNA-binding PadR family transcriptional regulator
LSPVFRHGSLRLYLLRLLDEEPRHGYEIIRLLRDRFMGVYSPSPGTIYPRLARLEEEGLVTHDEVDGRKVYRITDAGREELRSRSVELDELEEELSASVSDIVREVREDVRQTVRSLREELTWAAREQARQARDDARQARDDVRDEVRRARDEAAAAGEAAREHARAAREQVRDSARATKDEAREARDEAKERARQARDDPREQTRRAGEELLGSDAARRVHERAQRLREETSRARDRAREGSGGRDFAKAGGSGREHGDPWEQASESGAAYSGGERDSEGWQGWTGWAGKTEWPGRRGWEEWTRLRGRHGWTGPLDMGTLRDLERLAVQFTSDLRRLATQSAFAGENMVSDLRVILEEALERVKTEVFGASRAEHTEAATDRPPRDERQATDDDADA